MSPLHPRLMDDLCWRYLSMCLFLSTRTNRNGNMSFPFCFIGVFKSLGGSDANLFSPHWWLQVVHGSTAWLEGWGFPHSPNTRFTNKLISAIILSFHVCSYSQLCSTVTSELFGYIHVSTFQCSSSACYSQSEMMFDNVVINISCFISLDY